MRDLRTRAATESQSHNININRINRMVCSDCGEERVKEIKMIKKIEFFQNERVFVINIFLET